MFLKLVEPLSWRVARSAVYFAAVLPTYLSDTESAFAQNRQTAFFPTNVASTNQLVFFEIFSQPVSEALIAFALQGNLSIGLQEETAAAIVSPRVSGLYSASDGLRLLLSGTGLNFEFIDERTVRVYRDTATRAAPNQTTPDQRPGSPIQNVDRVAFEELLVTSTKRARDPQDVAVSVASVGAEQINAMGVRDTDGLVALVAGLSTTNQGPGRNKIFLRGQSDGPIAERTQSTVGIYIDESPLVYSDTNPDFRLVDVERIEVLRGPQGTLFGAGSLGGTFRIITNKPDPTETLGEISVSGAVTNSGTPSYTADGMINIPLSEGRSAVRLAAFYDTFGGFIDDIRLNEDDINKAEILGGRMTYATDIRDSWSAILTGNAQKN